MRLPEYSTEHAQDLLIMNWKITVSKTNIMSANKVEGGGGQEI